MRGMDIAVFVICCSLAISVLGGLGWFALAGVQPDPGLEEGVEQVDEEAAEPSASDAGGDEFSIARGVVDTINAFRTVTTQVGSALTNIGVPGPLATAIQLVISLSMAVAIVQMVRGVVFR